jgi:hypothetical protein
MNNQKITPEKVTRPIQLLAAWLVGLVAINGSFLATAATLGQDSWERSALIIAAIINVPIFLIAFFLLQTKFRAELQEDSYYHRYLNKKTNEFVSVKRQSPQDVQILELTAQLKKLQARIEQQNSLKDKAVDDWGKWVVTLNDLLTDFSEIRAALKKNHIPLASFFGSTNASEPPTVRLIHINRAMDFKSKVKLLRILSKFDFQGYQYFIPNEIDTDDVYIGSYGQDEDENIVPFTEEFSEFIQKDIEQVDLQYFENKTSRSNINQA